MSAIILYLAGVATGFGFRKQLYVGWGKVVRVYNAAKAAM